MQTNSNPWREIKQYVRVEKQQKLLICMIQNMSPD